MFYRVYRYFCLLFWSGDFLFWALLRGLTLAFLSKSQLEEPFRMKSSEGVPGKLPLEASF